jgi:hypothetical protein
VDEEECVEEERVRGKGKIWRDSSGSERYQHLFSPGNELFPKLEGAELSI